MGILATVGGYLFGYDEDVAVEAAINGYHSFNSSANAVYRVTSTSLTGHPALIPLNEDTRASLHRSVGILHDSLTDKFFSCVPSNSDCLPWSVAQVAIALNDVNSKTRSHLQSYMLGTLDPGCNCWHHFGNRHLAASSWALLALSVYGLPVQQGELEGLIDLQSTNGWWPVFPSEPNLDYASTYASTMAVLAIETYLDKGLIAPDRQAAAKAARDRGVEWLKRVRGKNGIWRDYPYSDYYSIESVGLSGLVLYALHNTYEDGDGNIPDWLREWDRDWLEAIPEGYPEPTDENTSLARITTTGGQVIEDTTRHYKLPGTLLGIAKTYHSGTPRQRVKALRWVESALDDREIATPQVLKQYWLAAELLISLRQIEAASTMASDLPAPAAS